MTVPVETSRSTYTGNGVTTVFGTNFYFLAEAHLRVTLEVAPSPPTAPVLGVDYTVTMPVAVGGNGSVTMLVAPPSGSTLVIVRDVALTQETSFRTQGSFNPAIHEDAFDMRVMQVQELDRRVADLEALSAPNTGIAGDGLDVDGGGVWSVGAGVGVIVGADDVSVDFGGGPSTVFSGGQYDGIADKAARADHGHNIAVGAVNALDAGGAGDPGSGTLVSLANHVHAIPTAVPVNVNAAVASAGVATTFVHSDHKHSVDTATAIEITDATSGAGTSDSLARANHQHSHGNRSGGTLHALATASVAGFMSSSDKTKLDALLATTELWAEVDTVTATPTTLIGIKPHDDAATYIDVRVVALRTNDGSQAAGYGIRATVKMWAGAVVLVGQARIHADQESNAAWDVTLSVLSPEVIVAVTGASDVPIRWVAEVRLTTAYI